MGGSASGKQLQKPSLTKGVATKEGPCQKLEGCGPPGEKTSKEKFNVKKWPDLERYIKELLEAKTVEIYLVIATRRNIPNTLIGWEIGKFQVNFLGEKKEEESRSRLWRYEWWESKESDESEEPPEEEALAQSAAASIYSKGGSPSTSRQTFDANLRKQKEEVMPSYKYQALPEDIEVNTEEGFEQAKEEALGYYRLFTEVVAEIDNTRARQWFSQHKKVFDRLNKWFKDDWPERGKKWPFPRGSGPRAPVVKDGLILKCPKCGREWVNYASRRVYDDVSSYDEYNVEKEYCPYPNCGKYVQPLIIETPWSERVSLHADLLVDDASFKEPIKKMMNEEYSVPLLTVNFNLDQPEQTKETEGAAKQTLEQVLPRPDQLGEVAEKLKRHLEVLEKSGVQPVFKVRGYADSSGSCNYNRMLSQERADWLVDRLKNDLSLKLPTSVKAICCGKAFSGDKQFKDLWESERQIREASGKPVDEQEADRVAVIELCPPEKSSEKKSST